jgi:hypothetical protein
MKTHHLATPLSLPVACGSSGSSLVDQCSLSEYVGVGLFDERGWLLGVDVSVGGSQAEDDSGTE